VKTLETSTATRRIPAGLSVVLVVVALLAAACTSSNSSAADPTPAPTLPLPAPPSPDPVETPCLSVSPGFTARGTVSVLGGTDPDARQLSGLDWIVTPGCERIIFSFLTDEAAPASSIGLSRLEFFAELGIVRVSMPRGVDVTGIAAAVLDGELVDKAFVVRSRSGELAVDLHVGSDAAVEARGLIIGSPARLVIDVRPGPVNEAFGTQRPTVGDNVIILSPAAGDVEYPLRIRGYARTLDDVVTATVKTTAASVERRVVAAPSADAWGEYAVTISEGPTGNLTLTVEVALIGRADEASVALTTSDD
jgi:hypothetical protein